MLKVVKMENECNSPGGNYARTMIKRLLKDVHHSQLQLEVGGKKAEFLNRFEYESRE